MNALPLTVTQGARTWTASSPVTGRASARREERGGAPSTRTSARSLSRPQTIWDEARSHGTSTERGWLMGFLYPARKG